MSGMWLQDWISEGLMIRLRVENMISILSSIAYIIWGRGEGGAIWPFDEYKNLHFTDDELQKW